MKQILLMAALLFVAHSAQAQDIETEQTVPVPSNGVAGGTNAAVWKAHCQPGMVMTGIEIVVGGTCQNQCDADGRPLAAYRILCSHLKARQKSFGELRQARSIARHHGIEWPHYPCGWVRSVLVVCPSLAKVVPP